MLAAIWVYYALMFWTEEPFGAILIFIGVA